MQVRGIPFGWNAPIPAIEYDRPTQRVARDLVGKILVRRLASGYRLGRITETEAYLGQDDPACHLARGFTPRTRDVWGRPGTAYVFVAYGLHRCFNAITLSEPPYGGVLVRGIEPLDVERGRAVPDGHQTRDGPGKLTRYLHIGRIHDGTSLVRGRIRILSNGFAPVAVRVTPRIGISKATEEPLRFVATGFRDP